MPDKRQSGQHLLIVSLSKHQEVWICQGTLCKRPELLLHNKKIKKSKKPGQKNAHSFSWSEAALELRYDKPRMERNISTSKDSLINCDKSEVWVNLCPIGEAIQAISKLLLLNQPAARALCFDSHS